MTGDYQLITRYSADALAAAVRHAMRNGWVLYGNPAMVPVSNGDVEYAQALVKPSPASTTAPERRYASAVTAP